MDMKLRLMMTKGSMPYKKKYHWWYARYVYVTNKDADGDGVSDSNLDITDDGKERNVTTSVFHSCHKQRATINRLKRCGVDLDMRSA